MNKNSGQKNDNQNYCPTKNEAMNRTIAKLMEVKYQPPLDESGDWRSVVHTCTSDDCESRESSHDEPFKAAPDDSVQGFHVQQLPALWLRVGTVPGEKNSVLCQKCSASWQRDLIALAEKENPRAGKHAATRKVGVVCLDFAHVLERLARTYQREWDPSQVRADQILAKVMTQDVPGGCVVTGVPMTYSEAYTVSKRTLEEVLSDEDSTNDQRSTAANLLQLTELEWDGNGFPPCVSKEIADLSNAVIDRACSPAHFFIRTLLVKRVERSAEKHAARAEEVNKASTALGDLLRQAGI